jgi:hypothetical protein
MFHQAHTLPQQEEAYLTSLVPTGCGKLGCGLSPPTSGLQAQTPSPHCTGCLGGQGDIGHAVWPFSPHQGSQTFSHTSCDGGLVLTSSGETLIPFHLAPDPPCLRWSGPHLGYGWLAVECLPLHPGCELQELQSSAHSAVARSPGGASELTPQVG